MNKKEQIDGREYFEATEWLEGALLDIDVMAKAGIVIAPIGLFPIVIRAKIEKALECLNRVREENFSKEGVKNEN